MMHAQTIDTRPFFFLPPPEGPGYEAIVSLASSPGRKEKEGPGNEATWSHSGDLHTDYTKLPLFYW
jgi:hypothetical protein